jgi:hypothetical protein
MRHSRIALVAVLLVVASVATPAAAQTAEDSVFAALDPDGDEGDSLLTDIQEVGDWALAVSDSVTDRVLFTVERITGDTSGAEAVASDLTTWTNNRSGELINYANQHLDAVNGTEFDVLEVTLEGADGSATRYVTADVNSTTGNYTSLEVVESTNRTVDQTITLSEFATSQLNEDVRSLYDTFVTAGEYPDGETMRELVATYGTGITVSDGGS